MINAQRDIPSRSSTRSRPSLPSRHLDPDISGRVTGNFLNLRGPLLALVSASSVPWRMLRLRSVIIRKSFPGRRIGAVFRQPIIAPSWPSRAGAGARILVLGLTFKENVPDLRNSRVIDIITALKVRGFDVEIHDSSPMR